LGVPDVCCGFGVEKEMLPTGFSDALLFFSTAQNLSVLAAAESFALERKRKAMAPQKKNTFDSRIKKIFSFQRSHRRFLFLKERGKAVV